MCGFCADEMCGLWELQAFGAWLQGADNQLTVSANILNLVLDRYQPGAFGVGSAVQVPRFCVWDQRSGGVRCRVWGLSFRFKPVYCPGIFRYQSFGTDLEYSTSSLSGTDLGYATATFSGTDL